MRSRIFGLAAVTCVFLAAASPSSARVNGVEAVIKAQKKEEPAKKSAAAKAAPRKAISKPAKQPETRPESLPSEAPQPPIIVIDPGHGGKDPGATGTFGKKKKKWSVREKDVVLQISKHVAAALKKKLGAKVSFTRSDDRFIALGERNRVANRRQCDLFLSVHANAAKNPRAEGLEIYSLNKATDEASARLAARENAGMPAEEKDIEAILSDLLQTAVAEDSVILASDVEKALKKKLGVKYKVGRVEAKTALFYVLVGAKCPSLLIETGFVTNEKEGKRLKQGSYQRDLANAIAEGVAAYLARSEDAGGDL